MSRCWFLNTIVQQKDQGLFGEEVTVPRLLLLSHFSRVQLLCDPRDSSPPGYPIPGILQVRTLEWVAISFSNVWKWKVNMKSLSHPMDWSLPSSSVQGIFQARVLEWGAIAFSSSTAGAGKIQDTPITFCDVRKSVQKEMKTCSIQESTQRSS